MAKYNTGPDARTRELVMERDGWRCVRCGNPVTGEPGVGFSLQHRVPRGMGGSRNPRLNMPANLVLLCGSGTTMCHGHVESNRAYAREHGWLLWRSEDPAEIPVTVSLWPGIFSRYLLDDLGGREEVRHG